MKGISRILGLLSGALFSVGALAALPQPALASHNVYPPGWDQPATNLPQPTYDFRAGCGWGDYQRYPSDQTGCGSPKSRSMIYGPVIYQMNPQGERYHRVY